MALRQTGQNSVAVIRCFDKLSNRKLTNRGSAGSPTIEVSDKAARKRSLSADFG